MGELKCWYVKKEAVEMHTGSNSFSLRGTLVSVNIQPNLHIEVAYGLQSTISYSVPPIVIDPSQSLPPPTTIIAARRPFPISTPASTLAKTLPACVSTSLPCNALDQDGSSLDLPTYLRRRPRLLTSDFPIPRQRLPSPVSSLRPPSNSHKSTTSPTATGQASLQDVQPPVPLRHRPLPPPAHTSGAHRIHFSHTRLSPAHRTVPW
ncbi:hypothetical protein ARMGADRAFT_1161893 [Armillaria gallica]|uniref:Uncharacterized protein n=1 Tax=Armillaria gallica TaxID=47427 RepID=A0A2H3E4B4_ARMGA|nr:hypothetical protein ARMGADRAFT_1161893 [Armillaria gallica]